MYTDQIKNQQKYTDATEIHATKQNTEHNNNNNKLPNIIRIVGMNKRPNVLIRSRPGFHGSRVSTVTILTEVTEGWIRG
jgi:hypothetical protein